MVDSKYSGIVYEVENILSCYVTMELSDLDAFVDGKSSFRDSFDASESRSGGARS